MLWDIRRIRDGRATVCGVPDKLGYSLYVATVLSHEKLKPVGRDLEERIQQLCSDVIATDQDEELNRLCLELRDALNEHIGHLRQRVAAYRNSLKKKAPVKGD